MLDLILVARWVFPGWGYFLAGPPAARLRRPFSFREGIDEYFLCCAERSVVRRPGGRRVGRQETHTDRREPEQAVRRRDRAGAGGQLGRAPCRERGCQYG